MNNGGPLNIRLVAPRVPDRIRLLGRGTFGIQYDFTSRAITDPLPDGWGSKRSYLYSEVAKILKEQGFGRTQYSIWRRWCSASHCWSSMFAILNIMPFGFAESTIQGLSMYQLKSTLMDVTEKVTLGAQHSRVLRGLTPRGLISPHVRNILSRKMRRALRTAEPHLLVPLPQGVRNTHEARNADNWLY